MLCPPSVFPTIFLWFAGNEKLRRTVQPWTNPWPSCLVWCGGLLSAAGKQIRGGERGHSGNSSGAVHGCDSGAAAVRRRTAWSEWFWYGTRRRRCRGGSSASASAAKSLRALRWRLRWPTTSGYRLRRDGGGRWWIGRYGVEDGGGWGFAAGGEGVFVPMEYEWGNGGRWGT